LLSKFIERIFGKKSGKPNRTKTSDRLRVVIELSSFDKGGLEKVVLDQALSFDPVGFEVVIVTPGKLGHLATVAERQHLRVEKLPEVGGKRAYKALLQSIQPDVAISHFCEFGYPLFHELNIPNVTFIHNIYAFMPNEIRENFIKNDRYVTRYISVSPKASIFASENLGVLSEKIITVPNGLIIEEHENRLRHSPRIDRSYFGLNDRDYVFLNPASYNLHKGHYVMANALKKILRVRDDIKILCIGNTIYPPHVSELTRYIKENGLEHHMLMPGYYDAIEDPMRIADACLMPSFIEGWSIAMNEAMFYGKPLILTNTGGAEEVIENNDIGILIPTEYPDYRRLTSPLLDELAYKPRQYRIEEDLVNAMIDFADNRQKWAAAGLRGREKLLRLYDFNGAMRRYETVLSEVVRSSGQKAP